ncbi:DUF5672 family protein [Caballeronia sp. BR00000012568055]|uniref:DUF5672 family protein n=1 Tax=Caballeronia sp. BR00000012568055 TaxID=2918761 RepID=UPI0023F65AE7|nr:DUF5672 family protein [Caballeronia sp. BR00000012568055]
MNSGPRLDLRNVTVCAVDCVNPRLASRAIDISSRHCEFGDAILFTHEDICAHARIMRTPHLASREAYNDYVLKEMIEYIHTPWVLVIQWDGYVVDPAAWRDEFFQYDYIGARWPWHNDGMSVGNGGFSLRSAKLMRLLASDAFPLVDGIYEDKLIGRHYRPRLEAEHGIRFAPDEVADQFSFENSSPPGPTFGFHSPHNMCRFLSEQELIALLDMATPRTITSRAMIVLLANYFCRFEFAQLGILYGRTSEHMPTDEIRTMLTAIGMSADLGAYCVTLCEHLGHRATAQHVAA